MVASLSCLQRPGVSVWFEINVILMDNWSSIITYLLTESYI
jgi:hypothetical protein